MLLTTNCASLEDTETPETDVAPLFVTVYVTAVAGTFGHTEPLLSVPLIASASEVVKV